MSPLAAHQPWCDPARHYDGTQVCFSTHLVVREQISTFLQYIPGDGTTTAVFGEEGGLLLDRAALRPLAMALLAHDATLNGDPDLARYYRTEAGA